MNLILLHKWSFALNIHILMGIVAAFIAFPAAIMSQKGSRIHVYAGRLFVVSFILICLTGYDIDADELLKIPFINALICNKFNFYFCNTTIESKLHILLTFCINTFALYLSVSGWRIANQHHHGVISKKLAFFDGGLAILEIIMVFIFTSCIFYDLYFISGFALSTHLMYYFLLIFIACIPLIDAGQDLYLSLVRKKSQFWWKIHLRKMLMAEYGLIIAFLLRCLSLKHYWLVSLITILFIAIYLRAINFSPKIDKNNYQD